PRSQASHGGKEGANGGTRGFPVLRASARRRNFRSSARRRAVVRDQPIEGGCGTAYRRRSRASPGESQSRRKNGCIPWPVIGSVDGRTPPTVARRGPTGEPGVPPLRSGLDQTGFVGEYDGLDPVPQSQLH